MAHTDQSLWDKIWKDKDGHVVIWQMPNIWLAVWAIATFVSLFLHDTPANVLSSIGSVFLAIWALLEIVKGVNYFRRGLGLIVLAVIIAGLFGVGR